MSTASRERAFADVVLAIASERSLDSVLDQLVAAAKELAGARYAALGIPDADGDGFARFVTAGMSDELIERIGPLPRRHGLLGAMLAEATSYRTPDIRADPRYEWWPPAHPDMRSFLGVPVLFRGDVIAAFYLTEKIGAPEFTAADQELIELLAAHAAIAIENARLNDLARELSIADERARLARELHDAMNQTLFSLVLVADAAAAAVRTDPDRAEAQLRQVKELARATMGELRALVFDLRPAVLQEQGLAVALRSHVKVLRRAHPEDIVLEVTESGRLDGEVERQVFRIAQEAVTNALRHAQATRIAVALRVDPPAVALTVTDDGRGFDPHAPSVAARRLGLTSMRERAAQLGATLEIDSSDGTGTRVQLTRIVGERGQS